MLGLQVAVVLLAAGATVALTAIRMVPAPLLLKARRRR